MGDTLKRYLGDHAAPEVAYAEGVDTEYDAAIVVPARAETPRFADRLQRASADGRVLAVVVVNGSIDDAPDVHETNRSCLEALYRRAPGRDLADGGRWVHAGAPDLLVVDRASAGRRLAVRHGVGAARRIGADIVAALWHRGRLRSPWIHGTDADATPSRDHFRVEVPVGTVGLVYPYWHVEAGEPALDEAVALYEIGLRWYVVGLATAGSPWALSTIGSCMSVHVEAYAAVRGVPRRQAAEDFYLLAKVAKLGAVERPDLAPVEIQGRRSDRVPFGTGPGVRRLLEQRARGGDLQVYHPEIFDRVRRVIEAADAFAARGTALPSFLDDAALARACAAVRIGEGVASAVKSATDPASRRRRVHEWLDAFRTLKLVHALRDGGLASMPWIDALAGLPKTADLQGFARARDLHAVRRGLAEREPKVGGLRRSLP
jgi:hypothetical protein